MLLYGVARLYAAAGFCPVENVTRQVDMPERRTGDVVEGPAGDLMVLPLGGAVWDNRAKLDLLGGRF
ncbi:MAG: hypothetical protein CSA74_02715 [Rhodobacterales bacterium]|nr:MAG: hypothetical protein CSA74_02715 [Rhodobacterales bacterium]